ncbi:hypothetical protein [Mycoplasmopsis edwardii]|uniref:Uncharacterized protein n=1 Tax=Mycoplasmopsis edwardii TaxID=53558 RepID=A0ACD4PIA4_9BACT|nr:hypothetical protein [Mycoplasmopsis edwardii]WBP84261.1 hypothetical protein Me_995_000235 [Mycoplasmopsis edwardii]
MKKVFNKKFKFIFAGSILTSMIPLTAVSCLYEKDDTVVYAREFLQENPFLSKTRVANQNNKVLKNFEDNLYTTNILTFDFSIIDLRFKFNTMKVNNEHLVQTIDNIVKIEGQNISLNQKNYDKFKKLINETETNFYKYIASHSDLSQRTNDDIVLLINQNKLISQDFDKKFEELKELINEYKNDYKGTKSLLEILKTIFATDKTSSIIELEKKIQSSLSSLLSKSIYYIHVNDFDQVVTYDQLDAIVQNFVKNTPWAAYYYWSKVESSKPASSRSEYAPTPEFITFDQTSLSYKIEFRVDIVNNGIPSPAFQEIWNSIKKEYSQKARKEDAKKVFSLVWNKFLELSPSYKVDETLLESTKFGIRQGFGPFYLALGINPSTKAEDLNYRVFREPLSPTETLEFLENPSAYVDNNLDKILLTNKEYAKESKIKSENEEIKKLRSASGDRALNEQKIAVSKNRIALLKEELQVVHEFRAKYLALKSQLKDNPGSQEILDKIKKLKAPYEKDIEIVHKKIEEKGLADSKTTHFSLADLFSKLLFLNGVYKTQVTKVFKTNDQGEKVYRYIVEFFDEKQNKWFAISIYDLLKAQQSNKATKVDISNYIKDNLDGYQVDEHSLENANIRN